MVNKLAEIEPRSSGETVITNDDTGEDFFRPEQTRDTFIFTSSLDEYAEVTVEATHSQDPAFDNPLVNEEGLPIRPGRSRETSFTDPNEIVQFRVATPTAPTSGSLTVWREKDHTPMPLDSEMLNEFKELNEGRSYSVDTQEELTSGSTLTVGVRNPSDSRTSIFIRQFGISVAFDALLTTEIDHGSYTDGTEITPINKKPELQTERQTDAVISTNPTTSNAQESLTGFIPGGKTGTAPGTRVPGAEYEINPGQNITVELENDSSNTGRFGFSIDVFETVIR